MFEPEVDGSGSTFDCEGLSGVSAVFSDLISSANFLFFKLSGHKVGQPHLTFSHAEVFDCIRMFSNIRCDFISSNYTGTVSTVLVISLTLGTAKYQMEFKMRKTICGLFSGGPIGPHWSCF